MVPWDEQFASLDFYYPNELVQGTRDWENASHRPEQTEQASSSDISSRDTELQQFIEKQANENTSKKTLSDMRIWERYCEQVGEARKIEEIPIQELDRLLGHFFKDVKKQDGQEYEPDSLTSFQRSFNRYLSQKGATFNIIVDRAFAMSRETLAAKRKQLRSMGKGQKPNASKPITSEEQHRLFNSGQFGDHDPEALIRTVWYFFTLHMGMRGRDEHWKLRLGDMVLKQDENGEYVEWSVERGTKTRTGEMAGCSERAFKPKMYATGSGHCPVHFFKAYLSHRPPETNTPDSPFYLGIKYKRQSDSIIWYKNQPMGKNKLGKFMASASTEIGITDKKVTNHSVRKTMIQRLMDAKFTPNEVAQLSGHKNLKSLDSYMTASDETQKQMSLSLSNNKVQAPLKPLHNQLNSQAQSSSQIPGASGLFSNAVMTGCSFSIAINVNSATTTGLNNQPPLKRRRLMIDDSDSD